MIAAAMLPNAAFLLGIIICGANTLLTVKRRILLHERGLKMYSLFRDAEVHWNEVKGVYLVKRGTFWDTEIHLDLKDRDLLDLPSVVKQNDELADRIIAATAPRIKAAINQALDLGETVAFGDFMNVSPKGLEFRPDGAKGKVLKLRWKDIRAFVLGRFVTNPGAGGLATAASVQTQFRVTSEKLPVWICATANVMNFAIFLEIVEKRFGVEIDRP